MKHCLTVMTIAILTILCGCATAPKEKAPAKKAPLPAEVAAQHEALDQARNAARAEPNNADLQYKLGNALFDTGLYDQAREAYESTVRLDPSHASAHANLGLCLKRLGRLREAIDAYRAALAIDPKDAVTLRNLAIALAGAGDPKAALAELDRLLELQPDDPAALALKANTLFRLKQYKEAAQAFERIIRAGQDLADGYYNLGLCYFCMENWDAALTTWLTALAHDAKNPAVNKGLAVVYWKRAEYKRAWETVARCQSLGIPLDPEFINGLQKDSGRQGP